MANQVKGVIWALNPVHLCEEAMGKPFDIAP
jgi:hypothetical protein